MIPYAYRFHGHNSLRYVYAHGKSVRSRLVTIKWVKNAHRKKNRFAVVVSKKIVKSAVKRNRIRRRLYEFLRLQIPAIPAVSDIVMIVTSVDLLTMPYNELSTELQRLLEEAQLVK